MVMDSFEFNKVAGAVLGALMVTMGLGIASGFLFAPHVPAKPGYDLPSAPAEETAKTDVAAAPAEPLPVLLAKAEVSKGQAFAKACGACHNFEKGAGPKVGPPLWGVVGRHVASIEGFAYSDAMKAKGGDWTFEDINKFITNPKAYVPGTKMGFAGEENPEKRADIIDYLDTLADTPVPLPKP
jgi:cytochrome c